MRTIILSLVFALSACAQQRNTIYQQLFDGPITTAPQTSSVFYAIGQTQHKVTIQLTDRPALTCVGGFVDIYLEGSGTGAVGTYITIGNPISNISENQYGQLVATVIADIAMPYVRLVVNSFDTTNCSLTALYSGTISPTDDPQFSLFYPLQVVVGGDPALNLVPTENIVNSSEYQTHRVYVDTAECTGISAWNVGIQLQAAFTAEGPWKPIGYFGFNSSATSDVEVLAIGNYPLIRGWLVNTSVSVAVCNVTVYYWGSNDQASLVDTVVTSQNFAQGTAIAGGTTVLATANANAFRTLNGIWINNPCSAGFITLQTTAGSVIFTVGPNSSMSIPPGVPLVFTAVNSGLQLVADASLTVACVAAASIWYTTTFP